ncbi:hypothetical protein Q1695_005201 [Nippostrongylus brasiliensis]|nr:hypothetical protein Q1695_005201 [Nippostrongylus brasiliensis]
MRIELGDSADNNSRLADPRLMIVVSVTPVRSECSDVSFSAVSAHLDGLKRVQRISISGHIAAYAVEVSISDGEFDTVYQSNGNPMYSTLWPWRHRFDSCLGHPFCFATPPLSSPPKQFSVATVLCIPWSHRENHCRRREIGDFWNTLGPSSIVVSTPRCGRGDTGSLSPSHISAGRALDDGRWHELRWLHQFDSVQLAIDGVMLNQTTPTGLYRKLDFHSHVLWLEGHEVRRVSARLSLLVLSSVGCYRSTTIDFNKVPVDGTAIRGRCDMVDRCLPSQCENDGVCHQTSLLDYNCTCTDGHYGKNCHSLVTEVVKRLAEFKT